MPVSIVSRCKGRGRRGRSPTAARVGRDARRLLRVLEEQSAELTVSLVDDREMHRLNRGFRGIDRPTDVLAYAMREGVRAPGDADVLGDVVISMETAARQARRRGVTTAEEMRALLIHGVLHLLGYDHERSPVEARRMKAMERQLRSALNGPSRTRSVKKRRAP